MDELEKVINRLNNEITHNEYWDEEYADCVPVSLLKDALELLKAQEAVKPIENSGFYYCGSCRYALARHHAKHCSECGRAVKWDG